MKYWVSIILCGLLICIGGVLMLAQVPAGFLPSGFLAAGQNGGTAALITGAGQSIPFNSNTQLTLGTVVKDTGSFTGTANTLTAPAAGWYIIYGGLCWASASSGTSTYLQLQINGTTWPYGGSLGIPQQIVVPNALCGSFSIGDYLNTGDAVTLFGYNNTSGGLTTATAFLGIIQVH